MITDARFPVEPWQVLDSKYSYRDRWLAVRSDTVLRELDSRFKLKERYEKDQSDPILEEYAQLLFGYGLLAEGGELPDVPRFNRAVAQIYELTNALAALPEKMQKLLVQLSLSPPAMRAVPSGCKIAVCPTRRQAMLPVEASTERSDASRRRISSPSLRTSPTCRSRCGGCRSRSWRWSPATRSAAATCSTCCAT